MTTTTKRLLAASALAAALSAGVLIGQATADQPAMQNATNDKGGHRVAAIAHVDAAIAEVRAGMAYDRRN